MNQVPAASSPRPGALCLVLAMLALAPVGCRSHEHAAGEHGQGPAGAAGPELPGQSVTLWTERTELFMEHQPLLAGKEVRFAAHLTILPPPGAPPEFRALTAATVTLAVEMAQDGTVTSTVDKPSNPGIFRPVLTPNRAGACRLTLRIRGPQLVDDFEVGPCHVYADAKAAAIALAGQAGDPPGRVVYLKEQAWKTAFANQPVVERDLQASLAAAGSIVAAAGREARIAAPVAGRLRLTPPTVAPGGDGLRVGSEVTAGQLLGSIVPRLAEGTLTTLQAEIQGAQAELSLAERQLSRLRRLFAQETVARREVDDGQGRVEGARAKLAGAKGRLAQFRTGTAATDRGVASVGYEVRAPIAGTVVEVAAVDAANVEAGQVLVHVVDASRMWLQVHVFEADLPRLASVSNAWFTVEGGSLPLDVGLLGGRLVVVGSVVDPPSRTVPIVFELPNAARQLRIGQAARVHLAVGPGVRGLAIPASAVIEEAGLPVAYVQVEGEAFERRPLTLGVRDRNQVQVLAGLALGERVVTIGAWDIKLSASSGAIPAHGHAH
jgi:RND family efflux transporter MFP subunit